MNKSNLKKMLLYDLKYGIQKRWIFFIPCIIVVLFLCLQLYNKALFHNLYAHELQLPIISNRFSFMDLFMYVFKGTEVINSGQKEISIDMFYVFINIYIAFLIGIYPFKDLKKMGIHIILNSEEKKTWWYSKNIWVIMNIVFLYFSIYLSLFIVSLFFGNSGFSLTNDFKVIMSCFQNIGGGNIYLLLIVPILVSIGLSILQMTLSLIMKQNFGFIITVIIIASSIFIYNPFAIGNYLMMSRNSMVIGGSINILNCIFSVLIIAVGSCFIGKREFEKKDIFNG